MKSKKKLNTKIGFKYLETRIKNMKTNQRCQLSNSYFLNSILLNYIWRVYISKNLSAKKNLNEDSLFYKKQFILIIIMLTNVPSYKKSLEQTMNL